MVAGIFISAIRAAHRILLSLSHGTEGQVN
jgi:hypothetical protein